MVVRIVALGDEEREEAEVRRLQQPGDVGGVPHPLQVRPEVVGDLDLADGRPDAGDLQTVLGEQPLDLGQLVGVEVEDVRPPGAPDLDVLQAEAGHDLALGGEVLVDLVGESGEGPHGRATVLCWWGGVTAIQSSAAVAAVGVAASCRPDRRRRSSLRPVPARDTVWSAATPGTPRSSRSPGRCGWPAGGSRRRPGAGRRGPPRRPGPPRSGAGRRTSACTRSGVSASVGPQARHGRRRGRRAAMIRPGSRGRSRRSVAGSSPVRGRRRPRGPTAAGPRRRDDPRRCRCRPGRRSAPDPSRSASRPPRRSRVSSTDSVRSRLEADTSTAPSLLLADTDTVGTSSSATRRTRSGASRCASSRAASWWPVFIANTW